MMWLVICKNFLSETEIEKIRNSDKIISCFEESEKYVSAEIWNFDKWIELLKELQIKEENIFYVED